ncbi:HD domain-containing protein [Candidatus Woesearchaeota archaeon]|nr:HD domain-containing protein [Candidatus Woesearchaeota archaeon]
MKFYNKVEKYVVETFTKAGKSEQIKHFLRTAHWIKELKTNADEALLIAAVAHDIERGFRGDDMFYMKKSKGFTSEEFLRPHQERGAEIISNFLKEQGADEKLIKRVKHLVSKHEEGGDNDQNLLKDADSISFFENNVNTFLNKKVKEVGKEKVKSKFDYMFDRITSDKAKEICRKWYEKALKNLEVI